MSSAAEKLERAARGPHKEAVDIYGIDEDETQHQILVTPDGKIITRITGVDENGVQRTVLVLTDGTIVTQDTGVNTNPRRYELENGFRSPVVTRAGGVATALYTLATTPTRTAGLTVVVYSLHIYNHSTARVTAWLEIAGVVITVAYPLDDEQTIVIDFPTGLQVGDNDLNCNASANNVDFQVCGLEA